MDEVTTEVLKSFTLNNLSMFGFDTIGSVIFQAAVFVGLDEDCRLKQVDAEKVGDVEMVVVELFGDWHPSQLMARAGLKKLVRTVAERLADLASLEVTVVRGSVKVQITPSSLDGSELSVKLIYVKEVK